MATDQVIHDMLNYKMRPVYDTSVAEHNYDFMFGFMVVITIVTIVRWGL